MLCYEFACWKLSYISSFVNKKNCLNKLLFYNNAKQGSGYKSPVFFSALCLAALSIPLFLAAFAELATLVDSTAAQQNSSRCFFLRKGYSRLRFAMCCEYFATAFAVVLQLLRVVSTRGEAETPMQFASLRSSDMLLRGATSSATVDPPLCVCDACEALLKSRVVFPSLVDGVWWRTSTSSALRYHWWNRDLLHSSGPSQAEVAIESRGKCRKYKASKARCT